MEGNLGLKTTGPLGHPEPVDDEVGELPGPAAELSGRREVCFALEEHGCAVGHHFRAGAGRNDDGLPAPEDAQGVARDRTCRRPVTRIEGGLPAASLIRRNGHRAAQVLQNFYGSRGHVVVERVAQTGRHQLHVA
jgi:hypothetical protein